MSIIISIVLVKTGALSDFLNPARETKIIGSFLSGLFFVSVFTAAPALTALAGLAQSGSIFTVAFFGALGALVGDLIIFKFIKDSLSVSLLDFARTEENKLIKFFRKKYFRALLPFIGAIIIVSPFPDELGLMMMGLSRLNIFYFIPLAFALNFLGILIIEFVAK
ncbi:MAG: hypothetical protein AAB906_02380 [Patescibacteria group bacterium]